MKRWIAIFLTALALSAAAQTPSAHYGSGNQQSIGLYQKYISPIRGDEVCGMHPSCSQYSKQAFATYKPLQAIMASSDRLIRCGSDRHLYPWVELNGKLYAEDPVQPQAAIAWYAPIPRVPQDTLFADYLFNLKEYNLALLEYYKIKFNKTPYPFVDKQIAWCYYYLDQPDQLSELFTQCIAHYDAQQTEEIGKLLVRYHLLHGAYERATQVLYLLDESDDVRLLKASCQLLLNDREAAATTLQQPFAYSQQKAADQLLLLTDKKTMPYTLKKPWLAASLSTVVPGAGYMYTKNTQTALASFMLNGLLAWTTYEAYQKQHYALFTTTVVFGSVWYTGNIYGSAKAAKKRNNEQRNRFVEQQLQLIRY